MIMVEHTILVDGWATENYPRQLGDAPEIMCLDIIKNDTYWLTRIETSNEYFSGWCHRIFMDFPLDLPDPGPVRTSLPGAAGIFDMDPLLSPYPGVEGHQSAQKEAKNQLGSSPSLMLDRADLVSAAELRKPDFWGLLGGVKSWLRATYRCYTWR